MEKIRLSGRINDFLLAISYEGKEKVKNKNKKIKIIRNGDSPFLENGL